MAAFDDLVELVDASTRSLLGGEPVIYDSITGPPGPVTVTGIFDAQYVLAEGAAEAGVEALGPAVFLRLAELPSDPYEDGDSLRITIRGVEYRVTEPRPDGMGGIVLVLRKAA